MIHWLTPTDSKNTTYTCPTCDTHWLFAGPRNPFRWQCPGCNAWLTWRETKQLEPYQSKICVTCGGDMEKRTGGHGEFFGCENYPDCRSTRYKTEIRLRKVTAVMQSA
jgi:ssDNA-binding Zn-finger/Zn-ribbon topoisomerase 1